MSALLRRLRTIPLMVFALALVTPLFPALLLLSLLIDALRLSRTLVTTRLTCFLLAFLVIENLGLVLLFFTFLTTRRGTRARHARTFSVQRFYTGALLAAVRRAFSLRFEVQSGELAAKGPYVALVRHASLIDVLVPGGFIANAHLIELRYVLKKELLAEPCLDVAGHWIPNVFVGRDGTDTAQAIAQVRTLKAGLSEREGVLVFPEGTRFSTRKRERLLDGHDKERARQLQHLLPIRPGGAPALLEEAPACDVLFVGHHGLEGFTGPGDIWRGALVGRTITVKFWRDTPPPGAGLDWLDERWKRLDDWLETF